MEALAWILAGISMIPISISHSIYCLRLLGYSRSKRKPQDCFNCGALDIVTGVLVIGVVMTHPNLQRPWLGFLMASLFFLRGVVLLSQVGSAWPKLKNQTPSS